MHNYNKIRWILRARNGSQIPKLWLGGKSIDVSGVQQHLWGNNLFVSNLTGLSSDNNTETNNNVTGSTNPVPKVNPLSGTGEKLSLFSKNGAGWSGLGQAADMMSNMFFKGDTVDSEGFGMVNQGIDMVGNSLMSVNPTAGAIVKGAGFALNAINSIGGKRADEFTADLATIEEVGSSYGGSVDAINNAASKAGKKYGLFNNRARKKANRDIREARRQQNIMADIADEASDMRAMAGNDLNYISYQNNLAGGYDLRYMRAARHGMKISDKINLIKTRNLNKHIINVETKLVEEFKEGGVILNLDWEPKVIDEDIILNLDWEPVIESFLEGGKTKNKYPQEYVDFINSVKLYASNLGELEPEGYNMFRYWELNGKPKNWWEATHNNGFGLKPSMFEFIPGDNSYHARSVTFNLDTGEYEWMKHKNHNTAWMEKAFYDGYDYETDEKGFPIFDENLPEYEGLHPVLKKKTGEALKASEDFRNNYDLVEDENGYRKYIPKKKLFKQGGKSDKKFNENEYPLVTIKEEPWADNFFKQHPEVSGMAIGGGLNGVEGYRRVILNPYSKNINKDSVIKNERLRHWMEETDFELPEISKELFEKYIGTPYENDTLNIGRTEAARYLSGDSNLLTPMLKEYILGFKQGGKTKQELETPEIEETTLKNIIPEGALHKNKHHIEHTEGLTLKGIPVVDNEGELLAEIEHSEIIFTLEVTKKLEELYRDYYNDEHSQKEKDEAAIEAGKLLVYLILFNTDDRTDLVNKIQI